MGDLDTGKGLDMDCGPHFLDSSQDINVIAERQFGMDTTDHVDLGNRFVKTVANLLFDLLNAHLIAQGRAFFLAEGAELAEIRADIRVVYMLIVDKIGFVAIEPVPDDVGQITEGKDIRAVI